MKIPKGLLNQNCTVELFEGETGRGPSYGGPATVKCRIENKRRLVRGQGGDQVVSETTLFFYPEAPATELTPEARITVAGRARTIISVNEQFGLSELSHLEVALV